jgi:hypothetical protein
VSAGEGGGRSPQVEIRDIRVISRERSAVSISAGAPAEMRILFRPAMPPIVLRHSSFMIARPSTPAIAGRAYPAMR